MKVRVLLIAVCAMLALPAWALAAQVGQYGGDPVVGTQGNGNGGGNSPSDPDGDSNGGVDKPVDQGGTPGFTTPDGNNGSGNDEDCEDDNNGQGVPAKCKPDVPPALDCTSDGLDSDGNGAIDEAGDCVLDETPIEETTVTPPPVEETTVTPPPVEEITVVPPPVEETTVTPPPIEETTVTPQPVIPPVEETTVTPPVVVPPVEETTVTPGRNAPAPETPVEEVPTPETPVVVDNSETETDTNVEDSFNDNNVATNDCEIVQNGGDGQYVEGNGNVNINEQNAEQNCEANAGDVETVTVDLDGDVVEITEVPAQFNGDGTVTIEGTVYGQSVVASALTAAEARAVAGAPNAVVYESARAASISAAPGQVSPDEAAVVARYAAYETLSDEGTAVLPDTGGSPVKLAVFGLGLLAFLVAGAASYAASRPRS